jgi:hypothetical protein
LLNKYAIIIGMVSLLRGYLMFSGSEKKADVKDGDLVQLCRALKEQLDVLSMIRTYSYDNKYGLCSYPFLGENRGRRVREILENLRPLVLCIYGLDNRILKLSNPEQQKIFEEDVIKHEKYLYKPSEAIQCQKELPSRLQAIATPSKELLNQYLGLLAASVTGHLLPTNAVDQLSGLLREAARYKKEVSIPTANQKNNAQQGSSADRKDSMPQIADTREAAVEQVAHLFSKAATSSPKETPKETSKAKVYSLLEQTLQALLPLLQQKHEEIVKQVLVPGAQNEAQNRSG